VLIAWCVILRLIVTSSVNSAKTSGLNFLVIWTLSPTGVAGACVLLLELLALRGASLINVGALPARIVGPASAARPIERAVVLGPIKAKPFGWPRRGGQP